MAEKLTWDDAEKIGVLLARKHPELYPLSTNLEELHRRVIDLPTGPHIARDAVTKVKHAVLHSLCSKAGFTGPGAEISTGTVRCGVNSQVLAACAGRIFCW